MKKFVSIFLAALILYNVAGYILVFKTFQLANRNEVNQKIRNSVSEDELTIVRLTNSEIHSGKNGFKKTDSKEFRLAGKLYDIVRMVTAGDTNIIYCINDTSEEFIIANLDQHIKLHSESNLPLKEKSQTLFKLILTQAILQKKSAVIQNVTSYNFTYSLSEKLNCFYKDIPTPPPWQIV